MWRRLLRWIFSRYFVLDHVPRISLKGDQEIVDVVVVPSLCLEVGRDALVYMNYICTNHALDLVARGEAKHVIFLCAYEGLWKMEAGLRRENAKFRDVTDDQITFLGPVVDSYGEALLAAQEIVRRGWRSVWLVTNECHMMRALPALREALPADIKIFHTARRSPFYERTHEPAVHSTLKARLISVIKSYRSATFTRWLLWNILMMHAPANMKKMPEAKRP